MSTGYRAALKYGFAAHDIYYWDIGGVILIRLLPFMDDMGRMGHYDGIYNSNSKAAWVLATSEKAGPNVSFKLNGEIYRADDLLDSIRDPKSGSMDYSHCKFMIPIVTGKQVTLPPSNQ